MEASGYDPERDEDNPSGSVFCAHGAGFVVSWDHVKEYMHMDSGIFKENQGTGPEVFKGPAKNAPEGSGQQSVPSLQRNNCWWTDITSSTPGMS